MRRKIISSTIKNTKATTAMGRSAKTSMLLMVTSTTYYVGRVSALEKMVHYLALPAASSSRRALARVRFKTNPAPELLVREESIQNSPSNKARSSAAEMS